MSFKNFRRPFAVLIIGAILAGAGVYGYGKVTGSSGPTTANEWVNPNAGVSSTPCHPACQLDANTAYGTLEAAYTAASSGDVIRVSCGGASSFNYPPQTIDSGGTGLSSAVTIKPDPGCSPYVGSYAELTSRYTPFDTTINVTNTNGWTCTSANRCTIVIGGKNFGNITCGGKTSTSFTGCTGAPNNYQGNTSGGCTGQPQNTCLFFEPGANVAQSGNGGIDITGVKYITIDGLNSYSVSAINTAQHITYENASTHNINTLLTDGGDDINWLHLDVGPVKGGSPVNFIQSGDAGGDSHILYDDVSFDTFNANSCTSIDGGNCHMEAIFMRYANDVKIRNSSFFKTEQYDIFVTFSSTVGRAGQFFAENVLLQNDFFGAQQCGNVTTGVQFPCTTGGNTNIDFRQDPAGRTLQNWTIEYSTIDHSATVQTALSQVSTATMMIRANYWNSQPFGCYANLTYRYNVGSGSACTGTGNVGGASFNVVDESTNDLHLATNTTAALQAGDPTSCPSADIDGDPRPPSNQLCDAGADQKNTSFVSTGASLAKCNGGASPCTAPTSLAGPFSVGTVSNDPSPGGSCTTCNTPSARSIQVARPVGLTASATNLAPAVIEMGNTSSPCSYSIADPSPRIVPFAAAHKFVVIMPSCGPSETCANSCSGFPAGQCATGRCFGANWYKKAIDNPPSGAGVKVGSNDLPMIAATVNYITQCPASPTAGQCIDPERIWIIGDSSTAAMGPDALCDSSTNTLIRGYWMVSNSIQVGTTQPGSVNCRNPSTQATFAMQSTGKYDNNGSNPTSQFWGINPTDVFGGFASVSGSWSYASCGAALYWGGGTCGSTTMTGVEGCTGGITFNNSFIPTGGSSTGASHRRADSMGPCNTGVAAGSEASEGWNLDFGGHGANCQDSDSTANASVQCGSNTIGGTTCAAGATVCPKTNGWYGAREFVAFMEQAAWSGN